MLFSCVSKLVTLTASCTAFATTSNLEEGAVGSNVALLATVVTNQATVVSVANEVAAGTTSVTST